MVKYNFEDQVIIVTGGSNGIGAATVKKFRKFGGKVHVWDKSPPNTKDVTYHEVDITITESIKEGLSKTLEVDGNISILFNNAGIFGSTTSVEQSDPLEWQKVINVNLVGTYEVCRQVLPHMQKNQPGRIVNMASLAGKEGTPQASAYSAAKAGIIAFTKSLSKELAETNIRVNAVAPAAIKTAILNQMTPDFIRTMIEKSPMKRLGTAEEVANLVCWLCSGDCSFATGSTFDLSGGRATY